MIELASEVNALGDPEWSWISPIVLGTLISSFVGVIVGIGAAVYSTRETAKSFRIVEEEKRQRHILALATALSAEIDAILKRYERTIVQAFSSSNGQSNQWEFSALEFGGPIFNRAGGEIGTLGPECAKAVSVFYSHTLNMGAAWNTTKADAMRPLGNADTMHKASFDATTIVNLYKWGFYAQKELRKITGESARASSSDIATLRNFAHKMGTEFDTANEQEWNEVVFEISPFPTKP
jgi:hypothetical protein